MFIQWRQDTWKFCCPKARPNFAVGCPGWIEIPHKGVSSTVSLTCFHKFVLFMCNKTRRTTVSYKINLPLKDLWFLFSVLAGSSHNSNLFVLQLFILHPFQQFHDTCAHNIHGIHGIHGRLGFPRPWRESPGYQQYGHAHADARCHPQKLHPFHGGVGGNSARLLHCGRWHHATLLEENRLKRKSWWFSLEF